MSWEIESDELDKEANIHRYVLIERGTIGLNGEPARYHFLIRLGIGHHSDTCHHCNQSVERDLTLTADGKLQHATRGQVTPRQLVQEKIDELNAFHGQMDAYAKHHNAPLYKGPK